jgi:hypothetical protein
MGTKICTKCKEVKDISCFWKVKRMKDGFSSYCKQCRSEQRRVRYNERSCESCGKLFIPKMIDSLTCSVKCSDSLCKSKRKKQISEYNKEYYVENKESELKRSKKYYDANKEKIYKQHKGYHAKWRSENKDKIKSYYNSEWRKAYEKKRCAKDPNFKFALTLRKQLNKQMRKLLNGKKSASTLQLLGCSIDEFKLHLEELFEDGMTFGNYGKWHLDHILPCSMFDLQHSEEQEVCFHYTNLQPLWSKDNLIKSNRLDFYSN